MNRRRPIETAAAAYAKLWAPSHGRRQQPGPRQMGMHPALGAGYGPERPKAPPREIERIHVVRVVERRIGHLRMLFWKTQDGQCFTGRACHMRALAHARRLAQGRG